MRVIAVHGVDHRSIATAEIFSASTAPDALNSAARVP